jgi:L-glyceraldehyde 3-phosphate reductase
VESGRALYIGISSYSSEQTTAAAEICERHGWSRILVHQPNYSMLNRWIEKRLLATCRAIGAGIIVFCPLYQGLLTDKYLEQIPAGSRADVWPQFLRSQDMTPDTLQVIRQLNDLARSRGQSLAQMAIAWILRLPEVTSVLCGASRTEQIIDNCGALQNREFSTDELQQIDQWLQQTHLSKSMWGTE